VSELLEGLRILILEDQFLAALDLQDMVEERGGVVVGPVGRLQEAQALVRTEEVDGAILDVNLDGETSYPVADDLLAQGRVVVFVTGYDPAVMPERFTEVPRLDKPATPAASDRVLRKAFRLG
jgi:CheY-like chemotaxis protein